MSGYKRKPFPGWMAFTWFVVGFFPLPVLGWVLWLIHYTLYKLFVWKKVPRDGPGRSGSADSVRTEVREHDG